MKRCTRCGVTKSLDEFYHLKRAKDRHMSACIECWKAHVKSVNRLRAERPVVVLPETVECQTCHRVLPAQMFALNRTKARGCQSRCKDCHRERRYGLEPGEYDRRLAQQHGHCAICGQPPPQGKQLEVDHCHGLGHVRGLLCGPCNRMLGAARDSIATLEAAIEYLKGGG